VSQPSIVRVFEIVSFNVALTLVLGELSLQAFTALSRSSLIVSAALDAYRLQPGRDYGNGLRGNNLGFPGDDFTPEKRAGEFRIAAFGDSFAVGPAVPYEQNYLRLVEKSLPATEVYNFGVSGTGPREYRLLLDQYGWRYAPDLVLVSIFVGNDITEVMATPRRMDPRRSALYLFVTRGAKLMREKWREGAVPLAPTPVPKPSNRLADHAHQVEGEGLRELDSCARGGGLSRQTFCEIEAQRLEVCLKSPSPALEKKWHRAEAEMERIVAVCRRRHTPVAFVLIPDEFQINPKVLQEVIETARIGPESIHLQLPQRRLLRFFAERDVPCLDLLPAFTGVADAYEPHDTHWNALGNQLAARCMVEWVNSLRHKAMNYGGVALAK
jgi:hypothetical protein